MSQAPGARPNPPGPMRTRIEQASLPLVRRLGELPRIVPFLLMLVLVVVGLFLGGVVGFVIVVLALAIPGWMLYLGWPQLPGPERLMRIAVLLVVFALAVVTVLPR